MPEIQQNSLTDCEIFTMSLFIIFPFDVCGSLASKLNLVGKESFLVWVFTRSSSLSSSIDSVYDSENVKLDL